MSMKLQIEYKLIFQIYNFIMQKKYIYKIYINSLLFENVIHRPFESLYNMDNIQQHKNQSNRNPKKRSNKSNRIFLYN